MPKPTLEEELNYFARKNQKSPNLQRELDRYSRSESEGFANPALPYDPRVDMADAYAKYDPATWSKSFEKAWDTSVLNSFNSVKNIWQGVKEGIGRGDASAIFNNEYSRHLAEMTDNLEKMKPLYFTDEQQGSADQFLKQLFPALGYVVSSVVETAAVHAAATVVGGGYGAAVGAMAGGAGSSIGKGGMITKILAARRAAGS